MVQFSGQEIDSKAYKCTLSYFVARRPWWLVAFTEVKLPKRLNEMVARYREWADVDQESIVSLACVRCRQLPAIIGEPLLAHFIKRFEEVEKRDESSDAALRDLAELAIAVEVAIELYHQPLH